MQLTIQGETHDVTIVRRKPDLVIRVDGRDHVVRDPGPAADGVHRLEIDGRTVICARAQSADRLFLHLPGHHVDARPADLDRDADAAGLGQDVVRAPMPGAVVTLHCAEGEAVARGARLVTIESMKLFTTLLAPRDGVVATMRRQQGETFEKDEVIVTLAPLAAVA